MVRPRTRGGVLKVVPLNLDYDEFLEYEQSLPRGTSVSEEIRNYIKLRNEEKRKEKNLNSPDYSAITRNSIKQSTLDMFFPQHIIEWNSFKCIIDKLEDEERIKLTEIWLHDFRILELVNKQKKGVKVFPLLKV